MLKRLMNFLLFSTGITPTDHKEADKWAEFRAKREQWERAQRAQQDAQRTADAPEPAKNRDTTGDTDAKN